MRPITLKDLHALSARISAAGARQIEHPDPGYIGLDVAHGLSSANFLLIEFIWEHLHDLPFENETAEGGAQ